MTKTYVYTQHAFNYLVPTFFRRGKIKYKFSKWVQVSQVFFQTIMSPEYRTNFQKTFFNFIFLTTNWGGKVIPTVLGINNLKTNALLWLFWWIKNRLFCFFKEVTVLPEFFHLLIRLCVFSWIGKTMGPPGYFNTGIRNSSYANDIYTLS